MSRAISSAPGAAQATLPAGQARSTQFFVDKEGNVWLAGAKAGDTLLKFTADGKFLSDFGHRGPAVEQRTRRSRTINRQAFSCAESPRRNWMRAAHEIYIADGYLNKRMIVYDSDTGAFKRGWGAYGIPLDQINNDTLPPRVPGDAADQAIPRAGPLRPYFQ